MQIRFWAGFLAGLLCIVFAGMMVFMQITVWPWFLGSGIILTLGAINMHNDESKES